MDINKLLAFGDKPDDSQDEKLKHRFLIYIGTLMSCGGILWGSICAYFNLLIPAIIPYGYVVLTILNLIYFAKSKNFKVSSFNQILISMLLPFFLQWSLGGFEPSGAVMLWALLSIVASLTISKATSNIKWLAIFAILTLFTGFIDSSLDTFKLDVPHNIRTVFFVVNIVIISGIIFTLIIYVLNNREKTNHELEEKKNEVEKILAQVEHKVEERTEDLNQKNEALEEALSDLKQAQIQLVQSEKMAGLGTLVAGVAHEINNPTNFVYVTSHNIQNNLNELKQFIFKLAGEDADEKFKEMFEEKFSRLDDNIQDITDGSQRIKTIVQDLRTFSRLDEAEIKHVDITEGINSTLRIIRAKYKKEVEFHCQFDEKPIIDCWPAQLNQVFMNIMVNACQAIQYKLEKNNIKEAGNLYIRTFISGENLVIKFSDDGCGMDEETKRKIFEPFFTTKIVGAGVGMGMSITYGIIEKHNGSITVESELAKGSVITVYIPMNLNLDTLAG